MLAALTVTSWSCSGQAYVDVSARPKPQACFVRIFNLASDPVALLEGGRTLSREAAQDAANGYVALGSGSRSIEIKGGKVDAKVKENFDPGAATTLVVSPEGKIALRIDGEQRKPTPSSNVMVVFLSADGTALANATPLVLTCAGVTENFSPQHSVGLLKSGDWTAQKIEDSAALTIEDQHSYTLVVLDAKAGRKLFVLGNTPNSKPKGTGVSST